MIVTMKISIHGERPTCGSTNPLMAQTIISTSIMAFWRTYRVTNVQSDLAPALKDEPGSLLLPHYIEGKIQRGLFSCPGLAGTVAVSRNLTGDTP